MKRLFFLGSLILVFFVLASLVCVYGLYEKKMANAEESFLSFDLESSDTAYSRIQKHLDYIDSIPWVLDHWRNEIKNHRARNQYWQEKYVELVADGLLNSEEKTKTNDPDLEFIVANSVYRISQGEKDKKKTMELLDRAINSYRLVLEDDQENSNAAFNYEYLVRVRNEMANSKKPMSAMSSMSGKQQGIHGKEGVSPKDTPVDQIKIYIPASSDENKDGKDAGKGNVPRKKG